MLENAERKGRKSKHLAFHQAVANLCCVAFFYLLRVGEYAYAGDPSKKLTCPFRVKDIVFRCKQGMPMANTVSLRKLLTAKSATMTISNQKNGTKGQGINHDCNGQSNSPVKALARHINHILSNGGNQDSYINCYCKPGPNGTTIQKTIDQRDISKAVKDASMESGLHKFGYTRQMVSSHSLRSGGAMAMAVNRINDTTIMKQGRWKSKTFLCYIHEQISAFSAGLSEIMSKEVPFHNMAGPTLLEPKEVAKLLGHNAAAA